MKLKFITLALLFLSIESYAKITVVEVANGRAIVEYDKDENLEPKQILILKKLALPETPVVTNNSTTVSAVAPMAVTSSPVQVIAPQTEIVNRTHLLSGSLKNYTQTIKYKQNGNQAKDKVKSTDISALYHYNFVKYGLGASISYEYEDNDSYSGDGLSIALGGRYFFIDNVDGNKVVPYVGARFLNYVEKYSSISADLDTKLNGFEFELGTYVFLSKTTFVDIGYEYLTAKGDISSNSQYVDVDGEQSGLRIGFGAALE